jgi:glycosyltransferase involved in cell wall biosynthesis
MSTILLPLRESPYKSTWFKPPWISAQVLTPPARIDGQLARGALVLNQIDPLLDALPDLRSLFLFVERRGWFGINENAGAAIKLVEDLTTWDITRERYPDSILLDIGPADFVDHDVFRPLETQRDFDVIQVSCWTPRKRIELFIEAAARLPHLTFAHLGHFENGGTAEELAYRQACIALAKNLGARIAFPFGECDTNVGFPRTKADVNAWVNRARLGVLTALPEGINRFKMECFAADVPVLVANDAGAPTTKHIGPETGGVFAPTPTALADAIETALARRREFCPRGYLLRTTGKARSLQRLRQALGTAAGRSGDPDRFGTIEWDGRNQSMVWGRHAVAMLTNQLREHGFYAPSDAVDRIMTLG